MQSRSAHAPIIVTDEEWSVRHLYDECWIESYWKSRNHPHRSFLSEIICKFSPMCVLEIGCASGPNLYQIGEKLPYADVRGVDINPLAVQRGNEWFRQEGLSNVRLELGKAQELTRFADKSFDVVFTDAVLIYIPPDEIRQVIKEMLRIGKVVVLNEWHAFRKWLALLLNGYCYFKLKVKDRRLSQQEPRGLDYSFIARSASLGFYVGHWVRDYNALFEEFVPREKIRVNKLPKGLWDDKSWQRWGAVIEVVQ